MPAGTPDTVSYMILGYTVVAIVLISIVGYLVVKARNLRAELTMLDTLAEEESSSASQSVKVENTPKASALR